MGYLIRVPIGVPLYCSIWKKLKIFFQCITYFLLILNSVMYWLKYIPCKISIQQNLTFRGLFVSFSSRSVYENDFFVNFADHFVPLLLEPSASFPRSLRNIFLPTETRPVREKLIGRTVEGKETRQKAMVTEKSWSLMITWWKHKYWKWG